VVRSDRHVSLLVGALLPPEVCRGRFGVGAQLPLPAGLAGDLLREDLAAHVTNLLVRPCAVVEVTERSEKRERESACFLFLAVNFPPDLEKERTVVHPLVAVGIADVDVAGAQAPIHVADDVLGRAVPPAPVLFLNGAGVAVPGHLADDVNAVPPRPPRTRAPIHRVCRHSLSVTDSRARTLGEDAPAPPCCVRWGRIYKSDHPEPKTAERAPCRGAAVPSTPPGGGPPVPRVDSRGVDET